MEETLIDPTVFIDYCADCQAMVRSDDPCEHNEREWSGTWEW